MGVLVPGPASAGPQADCGTDQDATYGAPLALTPGVRCDAKVNDCDDATDYFTFTATGADGVRITFTGSGIVAYYLYGPEGSYGRLWDDTTFVVPSYGEGAVTYSISAYYNHNQRYYPGYYKACGYCDPYYGGCSYYEYIQEYDLRVDVTANTRPYVVASGPLSVIYGEPTEYAVYGLDADENGRRVGAAFAPPTPPTWTDGGFPSTKTFTYAFPDSRVAGFFAEDTVGAVASTFLGVTAREDDCGSGDDVATLARTLPFDCHGTLWEPIADHADAYTFTVPSGTPRLYAGYSPFVSFATGDATVRLVSPTGALAAEGTDTPLFVASPAAGTWTLELLRAAGSGSYDVTVAGVGEPTRPRLGVVVSDAAPHQYDEVAVEVAATHANGERVRYDVDWGDGTTARLP
ncbi:MAG TPA: hypothetical protein VI997_03855, partial [Candidatus Thermoplasmatota archaeon]|nr:hypothetical protein [Candidatus Thermoplasmatota archaeon]